MKNLNACNAQCKKDLYYLKAFWNLKVSTQPKCLPTTPPPLTPPPPTPPPTLHPKSLTFLCQLIPMILSIWTLLPPLLPLLLQLVLFRICARISLNKNAASLKKSAAICTQTQMPKDCEQWVQELKRESRHHAGAINPPHAVRLP